VRLGLLVAGGSGDDLPDQGSHDARGGQTVEVPVRILPAACRIRSGAFVEQVRGGRKSCRDKEEWDDAVPDLVR
jgi:hypothetical protein